MTNSQRIQLTSAADNALRLLDQMAKLEPFELSSAARELVRDASAPLRNALRDLTLQPQAERSPIARAVSRAVWATFKDGTRNQITVHVGDAATDADAVIEAGHYFTTAERRETVALAIVIHREDGSESAALPVNIPTDWAR